MTEPSEMVDHWWWRPGWRQGRSFYTWHVTFDAGSSVALVLSDYQDALGGFDALDVLSVEQAHATVQGVGFTDEVDQHDLSNIADAVSDQLSTVDPVEAAIEAPHVDAETVQASLTPVAGIAVIREAIQRGIGEVWGFANVPEMNNTFRPHVTLAYSNASSGDRDQIADRVAKVPFTRRSFVVDKVSLIELNRDNRCYEWETLKVARLGKQA